MARGTPTTNQWEALLSGNPLCDRQGMRHGLTPRGTIPDLGSVFQEFSRNGSSPALGMVIPYLSHQAVVSGTPELVV